MFIFMPVLALIGDGCCHCPIFFSHVCQEDLQHLYGTVAAPWASTLFPLLSGNLVHDCGWGTVQLQQTSGIWGSMEWPQHQRPFLKAIVNEANHYKRQDLLQQASTDQINAMSKLVLNLLKKWIPIDPVSNAKLKRYKMMLREVGKHKNSLKRRKAHLAGQKGRGFWKGLNYVYQPCLDMKW